MQEERFSRGQFVYQEGIDTVDKIYLVCKGDFQLSKELIKPIDSDEIVKK